MAQSPEMRASDADRDRVAALLREHTGQGRITIEEFNERLEQVYRSRTYGELARVTADLPAADLSASPPAPVPAVAGKKRRAVRAVWVTWAAASALNWVIWLIVSVGSAEDVYPWPLWVMGPWGVILLFGTVFGGERDGRD